MYCSECGKVVPEGASFCPSCGKYLSSPLYGTQGYSSTSTTGTDGYGYYGQPVPRRRNDTAKVVGVVIVAMIVLALFFGPGLLDPDKEAGPLHGQVYYGSYDADAVCDPFVGRCVTYDGGFDDDDAYIGYIETTEKEREDYGYSTAVRLFLSESIAGTYQQFRYTITSDSLNTVVEWKAEPFLTMYGSNWGAYHVVVQCAGEDRVTQTTYTFDFHICHWCPFQWEYLGGSFGFELEVPHSYVSPYIPTDSGEKAARSVRDYTLTPSFVIGGGAVAMIEEQLRDLYTEALGPISDKQDYADFILAYVQCAYEYVSDTELYGQGEYYAYPAETVIYGGGDCEDTSILCASLFKAAGFDSAVLLLPGHAMAGISLPGFEPPSEVDDGCEVLSQKVAGKTYYACETTTDYALSAGIAPYHNGHRYSTDLGRGYAGYGSFTFYPAEA